MRRLGFGIAVIVLLATAGSFVFADIWYFDVLASLRLQLLIACAALCLLALLLGSRRTSAVLAAAVLLNGFPVARAALQSPPPPPAMAAHDVSILFYNTARRTVDLFEFRAFVRARQPDVLALTEVFAWNIADIRRTFPEFPYSVGKPGVFGAVILSRTPIRDFRIHEHAGGPSGRTLGIRLCGKLDADKCMALLVLHPPPPLSADYHRLRDQQIMAAAMQAGMASEERAVSGRVAMIGDFNLTPWNAVYHKSLKAGGLADAFAGGPPHSTWFSTFAAAGLAIDHVWLGPGLGVRRVDIGPPTGSDHFAVYVELAVDVDLHW